jgi:hypothetical protein
MARSGSGQTTRPIAPLPEDFVSLAAGVQGRQGAGNWAVGGCDLRGSARMKPYGMRSGAGKHKEPWLYPGGVVFNLARIASLRQDRSKNLIGSVVAVVVWSGEVDGDGDEFDGTMESTGENWPSTATA